MKMVNVFKIGENDNDVIGNMFIIINIKKCVYIKMRKMLCMYIETKIHKCKYQ